MKFTISAIAVLLLAATAFGAGIEYPGPTLVEDDSSGAAQFILGNSPNDSTAGASADFDTSITYPSHYWDNVAIQIKTVPTARDYDGAGAADSGACVVVVQASNDEVYWSPRDSTAVTDSLAAFDTYDLSNFAFIRYVVHHGAGSDSAGVTVVITHAPHGAK